MNRVLEKYLPDAGTQKASFFGVESRSDEKEMSPPRTALAALNLRTEESPPAAQVHTFDHMTLPLPLSHPSAQGQLLTLFGSEVTRRGTYFLDPSKRKVSTLGLLKFVQNYLTLQIPFSTPAKQGLLLQDFKPYPSRGLFLCKTKLLSCCKLFVMAQV